MEDDDGLRFFIGLRNAALIAFVFYALVDLAFCAS